MMKTFPRCTQALVVCLATAAVQLAVLPRAQSQIDAKRSEAATLQSRLEEQGRELSIAGERFNSARIQRQDIEMEAASAESRVVAASKRWGELKSQLARRVRMLYMHPGAAIDAWLTSQSLADLARAQKFGSAVLTADNELVTATEKARHEVMARARTLDGLRDDARSKEAELASRRAEANGALASQRRLLSNVKGELAELIEEDRRQELAVAQARQQAIEVASQAPDDDEAAEDGSDAGRPTVLSGDSGTDGDDGDDAESEEPAGPPPAVRGGAGQAVATAAAQVGKPYEWAADGPESFDCSGLTMYAWASAGVSLPHSSGAQYASLPHVARAQLQPGDLIFYGSPIHHVGIYEGGGTMINAPQTGEFVRRNSIARSDYVGAARP